MHLLILPIFRFHKPLLICHYRYCPSRWIWLKAESFHRSSLKGEARRYSESAVRLPSCESPLKSASFFIGHLETNGQRWYEIHCVIVNIGTMLTFWIKQTSPSLPPQLSKVDLYMRIYAVYWTIIHATHQREERLLVRMGKTGCIWTGPNIATGIIAQLPTLRSFHSAVANIADRS